MSFFHESNDEGNTKIIPRHNPRTPNLKPALIKVQVVKEGLCALPVCG